VRILKKKLALVLLGLIVLSITFAGNQVLAADDQTGPSVGQVFKLESVRGSAREAGSGQRIPATLTLKLTITHVNESRVRFEITSGQISFGDNTYQVTSGEGRAVIRRFGWAEIHGNTTLSNGDKQRFRLEGMLHIERPRLVLIGLAGGIGNEQNRALLDFVVRLSRV
jgi:hypothetical protein